MLLRSFMKGFIMDTMLFKNVKNRDVFFDPLDKFFNEELNSFFSNFFRKGQTDFPNVLKNSGFPKMDSYYLSAPKTLADELNSGDQFLSDGTNDQFKIEFAVPGMKADQINLEIHPGSDYGYSSDRKVLEIYSKSTATKEDKVFQISELKHSSFSRLVLLPEDISPDVDPSAVYENGILKLSWPVVKKVSNIPKPKKIEVKSV